MCDSEAPCPAPCDVRGSCPALCDVRGPPAPPYVMLVKVRALPCVTSEDPHSAPCDVRGPLPSPRDLRGPLLHPVVLFMLPPVPTTSIYGTVSVEEKVAADSRKWVARQDETKEWVDKAFVCRTTSKTERLEVCEEIMTTTQSVIPNALFLGNPEVLNPSINCSVTIHSPTQFTQPSTRSSNSPILPSIQPSAYPSTYPLIHSSIHLYKHTFIHAYTHAYIRLPILHPPIRPSIYTPTSPLNCLHTHSHTPPL